MEERTYIYKETENYKAMIQEAGGYVFFHLDVFTWSSSVFKELKQLFFKVRDEFADKGHELIFSTMSSEKTIKLCKMMSPLYAIEEIDHYDSRYWVVAWETGLEI